MQLLSRISADFLEKQAFYKEISFVGLSLKDMRSKFLCSVPLGNVNSQYNWAVIWILMF